jgi:hypothetical protein
LGNASYGRHSSPQLRTGRVLAGEMPHDASGTGLADLERLMAGQALPGVPVVMAGKTTHMADLR